MGQESNCVCVKPHGRKMDGHAPPFKVFNSEHIQIPDNWELINHFVIEVIHFVGILFTVECIHCVIVCFLIYKQVFLARP
jgi:hypothetical protein